jgi:endonuclease/exonuclease/phosphatase family metal-dependent hydrolase
MDRLHIATLNVRNMADRWFERLPLLLADMAALQPDVMGLQEVVYPMQQDRLIGAAGEGQYAAHRSWAGRLEFGNSLLVRAPLSADEVERLDLGHNRSALRAIVGLDSGMTLLVVVTHLHHEVDGANERDEQVDRLLEWLRSGPIADAHAVVGDFNAHPDEPAAQRMRSHGYRSAMAEANGTEPAVTWPSGIQAPGMDTDGDPACLDYIWIRGGIRVASAGLAFDRAGPGDPTLYPSDHFGLSAHVELGLSDRWEDR